MTRIDAVFDIERAVNGMPASQRLAVRQAEVAPLVAALRDWMTSERARLSKHAPVAKAMDYMLTRWDGFTGPSGLHPPSVAPQARPIAARPSPEVLSDGRICLTNNSAERSLRGVALGRKAWLFAGSERGGDRAAFFYTMIVTAKLNDVDPQAWLADVLARIAGTPMSKLDELLPWNRAAQTNLAVKAA